MNRKGKNTEKTAVYTSQHEHVPCLVRMKMEISNLEEYDHR